MLTLPPEDREEESKQVHLDSIENHTFISRLIGQGDTVIDLGMNLGSFAIPMINRYGVRVLGVEPVPDFYRQLPQHRNLTAIRAAVTGGDDHTDIIINGKGCPSTIRTFSGGAAQCIRAHGITLAELIKMRQKDRIALVKVDIEGAEFAMLRSTPDGYLLRIGQMTIEYHDFLDQSLRPLVREADTRLRRLGFTRMTFSRGWTDVLYVNPELRASCRGLHRVHLIAWGKYGRGIARRTGRVVNNVHQGLRSRNAHG